jgi:hypothetical protein
LTGLMMIDGQKMVMFERWIRSKKTDQIWFARGYIGMISAAMCSKAWVALRTLPQGHMKLRLAWPCVPDAFRYFFKIHQDVRVWVHPSL